MLSPKKCPPKNLHKHWFLNLEFSFVCRKPYGNTVRWYTTIMNQPAVVGVSGAPKMAEKMAQFDAKKFAEMQGAGGKDNKKADKKKEQAPKKKEEKPAKKEEPKAEEVPAEPKKDKDPFAALPAGTLVMDEWKKMFSNNPEVSTCKL